MPRQQFASAKKKVRSWYDQVQLFFDRQKRKPIKAIFVVAQRGFSAQVEIKIGIRRDEKIGTRLKWFYFSSWRSI